MIVVQALIALCVIPMGVFGDNEYPNVKMCQGARTLQEGHSSDPISWLTFKFRGCTHVTGHLIVKSVRSGNLDFLNSITEVYGAVIIKYNKVDVPLRNLRIIRGGKLTTRKPYAINIFANKKLIDLRSLRSVVKGFVRVQKNSECFLRTIDWAALYDNPEAQRVGLKIDAPCNGTCDKTCHGGCWGPGPALCQTRDKCAWPHPSSTECCHKECVGGCTGPTDKDCFACRNFLNNDTCVDKCTPPSSTNKDDAVPIDNPNFKYSLGYFCRKKCPKGYFIRDVNCYKECGTGYIIKGQHCVACPGRKCSQEDCRLHDLQSLLPEALQSRYRNNEMHRSLIKLLSNCTSLIGDLKVNSVAGIPAHNAEGEHIRYQDLFNMNKLRQIHGEVHIDLSAFPQAVNLSFLQSLESVTNEEFNRGFEVFKGENLRYLGLVRLRQLTVNRVTIARNPKLCYMDAFTRHFSPNLPPQSVRIFENAATDRCHREGRVCDSNCAKDKGCWGPGPAMCVSCAAVRAGRECVATCVTKPGFYRPPGNGTLCAKCHPECALSCSGERADQCLGGCRNVKDGAVCVKACPLSKFVNKTSGTCWPCAAICANEAGRPVCSGPLGEAGPGGCHLCHKVAALGTPRCFKKFPKDGFFSKEVRMNDLDVFPHLKDYVRPYQSFLLFPCDPKCKSCFGKGPSSCLHCKSPFFKAGTSTCTNECPSDTFADLGASDQEKNDRHCLSCDPECDGCNGASPFNCTRCKTKKIYQDPTRESFFCNATCPEDQPYSGLDDLKESICTDQHSLASMGLTVGLLMLFGLLATVTVLASIYVWKRRARIRLERENLHAKITGRLADDQICLNVTDAQPNASHLRVIGISRIKKGKQIDAGAFGTVYKGVWTPEPETPSQIPVEVKVAIKELKNQGNKRSTEEFLSEARLMASVDHKYCIKLLGVCMTSELMLISEFMPMGNLKDYLHARGEEIGSKRLLLWALQIAKGMDYLVSRDIVHRDLAARNVLLETEDEVRITDFGLAKLVDNGEVFQEPGQRLPIKWLACECIRSRSFSAKSDVWAYGVTLWEMFTFGQPPYRDIPVLNLLSYLDSGERLPQPSICTLDMYMLMIRCWLTEPFSRPTFEELLRELKKMAADPGRYLIIEGDEFRRAPVRSISTITSNSVEAALCSAKGPVAVVDFDMAAASKVMETSTDSADVFEDSHYVQDPTSSPPAPRPIPVHAFRRPMPHVSESFEEADEVFQENDYENPLRLHPASDTSEYVAPSPEQTAPPSQAYMNLPPPSNSFLVSNPTYCGPPQGLRQPLLEEIIEDYPLTPHTQPTSYVNIRL